MILSLILAANICNSPIKLNTGYISSHYGPRQMIKNGLVSHHDGVDIAAKVGTPIYSIQAGKIKSVHIQDDGAKIVDTISVDDQGVSRIIRYAHLSKFSVTEGQLIESGGLIGYVGMTGNTTGPHVHISTALYVHNKGKYIHQNPEKVLNLCKYKVKIEYK